MSLNRDLARLAAVLLVAALPLAGCGNKGPLILAPSPQGGPPPADPVDSAATKAAADAEQKAADQKAAEEAEPAGATSVAPPSTSTVAPPPSAEPATSDDGTPGTPR
jgi:predicted small lipoprotein YifL